MPPFDPGASPLFIVDDDHLTLEVLSLLLQDAGFPTQAFDSGDAVLAHLRAPTNVDAPSPFAILIDMQMPGTHGNPLALLLHELCRESLLVAMSAKQVAPAETSGFDSFLLKPFAIEDLTAVLSGLSRTHADPPARAAAGRSGIEPLSEATFSALAQSMPPDQLAQLYTMCLDDADRRLELMRVAAAHEETRDDQAFRRQAHAIKGGCGMVGALELAALVAHFEDHGLPASDDSGPFTQFMAASERLRRMLEARIDKLQSTPAANVNEQLETKNS